MRIVIAVCLVTGFIFWDGFMNEGRYLDHGVRTVHHWAQSLASGADIPSLNFLARSVDHLDARLRPA